jgi:hypothetical protein
MDMNFKGMNAEEARVHAKTQLKMKKSSTKYNNLLRDLDRAPTSSEVERIMWNVFLAGDGLAMRDSAWQKHHRNV